MIASIFAVLLMAQVPNPGAVPLVAPPTNGPPVNRYDRAPAYLAGPYPKYHRDYYLPTQYNPSYAIPPSNLPLFPARSPDWSPSRSLWYSGRSVPWCYGYWYYPRYIPVVAVRRWGRRISRRWAKRSSRSKPRSRSQAVAPARFLSGVLGRGRLERPDLLRRVFLDVEHRLRGAPPRGELVEDWPQKHDRRRHEEATDRGESIQKLARFA